MIDHIKRNKTLYIVLALAFILRAWNVSGNPPHLTPDEASLGYNAYSILKTARDEHGQLLPIIFKSFGDYKPGLYIYLTIPFVGLLGLTELAVRLPSVIAGVVAVAFLKKIVEKQFSGKKDLQFFKTKVSFGTVAAVVLAFSPWHIYFSRGAWEVNVALTLTLAGIYFFIKSLKSAKFLIHSSAFFALTLITYQGAKLSTAIVLVILMIVYWEKVKPWIIQKNKQLILAVLLGIVIAFPVILSIFSGKAGRLSVFSVFSYSRPAEELSIFLDQGEETVGDVFYYTFHSEAYNYFRGIAGRWFNHFSARFLFFEGDWQNLRHTAPNHGALLLSDLLLFVIGLVIIVSKKLNKTQKFVLFWLVLAPLPAVLSRDQVHAVRSFNAVIPTTIIVAVGLHAILQKSRWTRCFIGISIVGSLIMFFDAYYVHLPIHDAKYWFYGYKQAVINITPIQNNYDKISFQQSYNQPYIYFLFYQKYDPKRYQENLSFVESSVGDVGLVEKLDNIYFERFSWPHATGNRGTLVAGDSIAIPDHYSKSNYKLISEIMYPDNFMAAFRILEPL